MECDGCAKWLGPDSQGTTSEVRSVAQGAYATPSTSRFSEGCSAISSVSANRFRSGAEPVTRDSRRGGSCRSEAVGGSHWSSRREQHSREVPSRSPPRCSQQDEVATNSGTGGVLQVFSRTSTQAGSPSPSSHRTKGSVRERGGRRGTQTRGSPGPGNEPTTSCGVFIGVRVAAQDRHFGEGARCSQTLSRRSWSSQEFRQVDGARSSFLGEHSSNAHYQRSGSGGVAQRPKLRSPQCHGVRRFQFDGQDWASGGQGATQLGHLGQDVSMQVHSKSSMMLPLIDAGDAKRRCVAAGSACGPTQ